MERIGQKLNISIKIKPRTFSSSCHDEVLQKKKTSKFDPIYRNRLVNMLVNRILKHGKKSLAYQILYRALKKIQQTTETNPLYVLRQAIRRVTLDIAVKARRVSGSTRQVPIEIGSRQGKTLAMRWLLEASRKRPGQNMAFKLSSELVERNKDLNGKNEPETEITNFQKL